MADLWRGRHRRCGGRRRARGGQRGELVRHCCGMTLDVIACSAGQHVRQAWRCDDHALVLPYYVPDQVGGILEHARAGQHRDALALFW